MLCRGETDNKYYSYIIPKLGNSKKKRKKVKWYTNMVFQHIYDILVKILDFTLDASPA